VKITASSSFIGGISTDVRSATEKRLIAAAKRRLDALDFYPRPVRTSRVRILHAPWWFRLPVLNRFVGYAIGPLILVKRPLDQVSEDLITHELTHVWQVQHDGLWMWLSYLYIGYDHNPYELMARDAARSRHTWPS
jgi:hypothetical protein